MPGCMFPPTLSPIPGIEMRISVSLTGLSQGAGSAGFVASMAGWYLLGAILLADVDFPIQLPVGDLSHIVKGRTQITGQPLPYDKF